MPSVRAPFDAVLGLRASCPSPLNLASAPPSSPPNRRSRGQSPNLLYDIGHLPPQPDAVAPEAPPAGPEELNAIRALEALSPVLKAKRGKRHCLQTHGAPPATMGAMDHDALSKSLFALPPVEADLLRIVTRASVLSRK